MTSTTTLTDASFDQALARTIEALKAEGSNVQSDIGVQRAMKDKLGVELQPHRILVAYNPPLEHQARQAEPDNGLLLPCDVVVREEAPGRIVVKFVDPQTMVGLVDKPRTKSVAHQVEQHLRRVCGNPGWQCCVSMTAWPTRGWLCSAPLLLCGPLALPVPAPASAAPADPVWLDAGSISPTSPELKLRSA